MNAVEIEEAISALADQEFDPEGFPYAFLEAFGNKATTIKRLKAGSTNSSDVEGGVLQRNNIHIAVCNEGEVTKTLATLKASPTTAKAKAKFLLATDGVYFEAEDIASGDIVACAHKNFPEHFGFFLPLAGISTVQQVRESAFDIKATGRLNRLYIELLRNNPDWGTSARRHEMNHFMARLIFCFFAEDTDIFSGDDLFTATIEQMSARDSSNTHEVIGTLFAAMNTKHNDRAKENLPRWAERLPYVNGGLFSGSTDTPVFSKIARSYLLHIGKLDWTKINPDIFGSMIQAVADDEERGALGLHYTSVSNILKVLNPLFLDELREQLNHARKNPRKLLNLRKRISKIRVFDPACGSGNFLVIAYKEMRALEAEINLLRGESDCRTDIPLTNFRGIELRDFPAEIARLALIIAEYQCDVLYRGQQEALTEFLPLNAMNWITCGNALKLDWLSICPPTGTSVRLQAEDLFETPLDQAEIDFENEGGETYLCGNPPFLGSTYQSKEQKADLSHVFKGRIKSFAAFDYVSAWFFKAAFYIRRTPAVAAFVATNSICQGYSVASLWPHILGNDLEIGFAHRSFKWKNNASDNAAVICSIVCIRVKSTKKKRIFEGELVLEVPNINAYLINGPDMYVEGTRKGLFGLPQMDYGNKPVEGGNLILTPDEARRLIATDTRASKFIRPFKGSQEVTKGIIRFCLWIDDADIDEAMKITEIRDRVAEVRKTRLKSSDRYVVDKLAPRSHAFKQVFVSSNHAFLIPCHTSENRQYLPADLVGCETICSNAALALYDAPAWAFAIFSSKMHLTWVSAVCGKIKTDFRYSNTLGWNTFPIPNLTKQNKRDLTSCAENILLARESQFPATIADLYDHSKTPDDLRRVHEVNDEVLERIYIGRRFKNDTERLETLFDLYIRKTKSVNSLESTNEKATIL